LDKTKTLETNAIKKYKKFLNEATEQRVKDIFQALVEIEQDHLDMVNANL
jgi:rubrerythrin